MRYLIVTLIFCLTICCKNNQSTNYKDDILNLINIEGNFKYYENSQNYIIKENIKTNKKLWAHKKLHEISLKIIASKSKIYYTTPNKIVCIDKSNGEISFLVKDDFTVNTFNLSLYENEIVATSLLGIFSFSNINGKILWSLLCSNDLLCFANPKSIIKDDTIYISGRFKKDNENTLFSYNLKNKKKINEVSLDKKVITNFEFVQDNLIFGVGQSIHQREIYSINKNNFQINWKIKNDIDFDSKIVAYKDKFVYFNFKSKIFELNTNDLKVKKKFVAKNNYQELFNIVDDKLISSDNNSFSIFSLTNDDTYHFNNIMTSGLQKINCKIYYVNKSNIKTIPNLKITNQNE
tara:strand:- start:37 stop:1083 length:1047 start_codon:yes stop_codon:yes gene_type:complete